MEARVDAICNGAAGEMVWLLEHPPLYTAGTGAGENELLQAERFPVFNTGRGGKFTYHGPGQRVAYVMLNLSQRERDLHQYIHKLEEWIIVALAVLGVVGERRTGRVGIWVVKRDGTEAKIAAIGVRVRRWVTFHGIALNVNPDLSHFSGIVPCGLAEYGVTSLHDLGSNATMEAVDKALCEAWGKVF